MGVEMKDKRAELPRDIDALIAVVIARDEAHVTRDEKIASLQHNLAVYARMIFSPPAQYVLVVQFSGDSAVSDT